MSEQHYDGGPVLDQKSSVKITTNAKGDAQVEIKVYDGVEAPELERVRALAVNAYRQTCAEVRS